MISALTKVQAAPSSLIAYLQQKAEGRRVFELEHPCLLMLDAVTPCAWSFRLQTPRILNFETQAEIGTPSVLLILPNHISGFPDSLSRRRCILGALGLQNC